jgi:hypothetical protein
LAADVVSGERTFQPSLAQTASLFGIAIAQVREELKRRTARETEQRSQKVDLGWALEEAWHNASEVEREVAFRSIGIGNVWDVLARIVA